jgi:hypothetical protein
VQRNEKSFKQANECKILQGYIFVRATLQPPKAGNHDAIPEKREKIKKRKIFLCELIKKMKYNK